MKEDATIWEQLPTHEERIAELEQEVQRLKESNEIINAVTLDIKISDNTINGSMKKIERFTNLIENLSKDEACRGIVKLAIVAEFA